MAYWITANLSIQCIELYCICFLSLWYLIKAIFILKINLISLPDVKNYSDCKVCKHIYSDEWDHHPASVVDQVSVFKSCCEYQLQVAYKVQGYFIHDY